MIDPGEGEPVDPDAATERGGRDPIELRVTIEPGTQGLVRGLIKNQRQWVRWSRVKDHAATASAGGAAVGNAMTNHRHYYHHYAGYHHHLYHNH